MSGKNFPAPFEFGVRVKGDTFTDRVVETARLKANFEQGVNTILISPRRMGKTSLVEKAIELALSDTIKIAKFDALKCSSQEEFLSAFATAVIKATSTRFEVWMEMCRRFLSRFVPKISVGTDPVNSFSVSFELKNVRSKAEEILNLPEEIATAQDIRVVVCIDEFQQIAEFDDALGFQRLLRSVWQLQSRVSYCLYGSRKSSMELLFGSHNYPFYRFGDIMYLKRILRKDWVEYICARFAKTGKSITEELAGEVADAVENYPAYVQQLAWYLWLCTEESADGQALDTAKAMMLDAYEPMFAAQVSGLTMRQKNFLLAVTRGVQKGLSTQAVIDEYGLGNSAGVVRVKKSLMEKDLIDVDALAGISIADPVFKLWLKTRFWAD